MVFLVLDQRENKPLKNSVIFYILATLITKVIMILMQENLEALLTLNFGMMNKPVYPAIHLINPQLTLSRLN
jgi:hypothetical protein